jgi:outer membrane protein assembly factor BamB
VPIKWSATDNVRWKVRLPGQGISNPIVWGDRVFVTASDGPEQSELHIVCLDRDSGRERWHRRQWGTAPTLFHATKSGMAAPSPVTDGERLYTFFGTGDVFCFDMEGGLVWHRSLAAEYGAFENRFAASSSPLVHDGALILQCDHYGASYVLAIDVRTGANRWKADRPECWLSWSSPQVVSAGDAAELIVCGSEKLDAYDPRTGSKLWTLRGLARECIPTPLVGHGLLFAVSGPNGTSFAIRPGGRGDVTESHVVWKTERGTPFVPSGILVGDRYYLVDDKGIATCLDAHSGKQLWRRRFGGAFTASPVSADGRIFFTNESGTTLVVDAASDDREVARNEIGEPVYASPAISQGRLFLRTDKHLVCIGQ